MLLTQETIEKFGYNPSSLGPYSRKKVLVRCDYCNNIQDKTYQHYVQGRTASTIQKDACNKCKVQKSHDKIKELGTIDAISEKRKKTNLERYGCIAPANNENIQKTLQKQNMEKYGVPYHIQSKEVKDKIEKTNLERYGTKFTAQRHIPKDILTKLEDEQWLFDQHHTKKIPIIHIAKSLNVDPLTVTNHCKKFGIEIRHQNIQSQAELEIAEYIRSLGITDLDTSNRTVIAPKELDLYIPSKKLAIEFCGLYWHSDIFIDSNTYHFDKMKQCTKQGIRLLTIFEDEWMNQKDICKSRIASACGVGEKEMARKCTIVKNPENTNQYLKEHHIQGTCKGNKLSYALISPSGETIAMMTFGTPRFNKNYQWELLRYVTTKSVSGGATRLFAAFLKDANPDSVVSYCDLRWGTGGVYSSLGFNKIGISKVSYHYIRDYKRYNRLKFTKKQLVEKYDADPSKTEKQIMDEFGFTRIYDCGHAVYEWKKP